jgi:hypothetical protein
MQIFSQGKTSVAFTISPNPATSQATLFIKGECKEINVTITNLDGRVWWHKENVKEKALSLPVRNFVNGLYFVIIKNKDIRV